jgi:hypothetical protein
VSKSKKAVGTFPRRPEKKFGPFHNGIGVAVWLNRIETDQGPRWFRSITLNSRRYRDAKTGEWKDASSFRPVDLATLSMALDAARLYIESVPLPGQPVEGEEYDELHTNGQLDEAAAS